MKAALSSRYQRALVTGASAGLGRAFAEMLLGEGLQVWGSARDLARLPSHKNFHPLQLDLNSPPQELAATFEAADRTSGGFDLLINNAGFGIYGGFAEIEFAAWRAQLDAMLNGTLHLSHLAISKMFARQQGALVNISSLAAEFPIPFMSGYNVAKSGLSAFSDSLMVEAVGTKVLVIDFRPGDYRTGFNQSMHRSTTETKPTSRAADLQRRLAQVWTILEKNIQAGPPPARAAADLRSALQRGRSGVVRSGGFFQAKLSPFFARFLPDAVLREVQARYFSAY